MTKKGNTQKQSPASALPVGNKVLTASTPEDIFAQVEEMKATLTEGQTLSCGAVGYNYETALYTIQIDII